MGQTLLNPGTRSSNLLIGHEKAVPSTRAGDKGPLSGEAPDPVISNKTLPCMFHKIVENLSVISGITSFRYAECVCQSYFVSSGYEGRYIASTISFMYGQLQKGQG